MLTLKSNVEQDNQENRFKKSLTRITKCFLLDQAVEKAKLSRTKDKNMYEAVIPHLLKSLDSASDLNKFDPS